MKDTSDLILVGLVCLIVGGIIGICISEIMQEECNPVIFDKECPDQVQVQCPEFEEKDCYTTEEISDMLGFQYAVREMR